MHLACIPLLSAETSAPRTPQPGGGLAQKRGPVNSIYSTYDKDVLNRPILRFNIFFVLTHAMWGPHTMFILLTMVHTQTCIFSNAYC